MVLEGFHAIKHAVRFGAEILGAWTADLAEVNGLLERLAPDVQIPVAVVDGDALRRVVPRGQIVAVVRRPTQPGPDALLAGAGHVVLLEDPRHLGNLGAVVRVAAAAGAAAVMTTGRQNPWHPDALRGSAGALRPAGPPHPRHPHRRARTDRARPGRGPARNSRLPAAAVLAFGTERDGLSDELLARASRRIALPMAPGVSSLNLATAVAATLYALKLAG